MRPTSFKDLPTAVRLAAGLFLLLLMAFYGMSQAQLVLSLSAGSGRLPGPAAVLAKYHGTRKGSRLHAALDPARPEADPKAMYANLGTTEAERSERRGRILAWVEAGASRDGWPSVAPIFLATENCARCHSRAESGLRAKADLPFDTYEDVLAVATIDTGMSAVALSLSSHNHLMGFAVSALLVSLAFAFTVWPRRIVLSLIALAFIGPAIDVASWWMTREFGHPFEFGVMLGGGIYALTLGTMSVLCLDEIWLRGRLRRLALRVVPALGRSDPGGDEETRA